MKISFEEISNDFINQARKIIKPSDIILSKIPENIENAYGIHLRKSDRGKSLIVEWTALGPQGTFKCNADKRVDFPECDLQPPGQ